jgi:hypothetical protein
VTPHTQAAPASFFNQVDVTPAVPQVAEPAQAGVVALLREIRQGQERQNELLQELVQVLGASHRQRAQELQQWKKAHPHLAAECRRAADALGPVQAEYLRRATTEAQETAEEMADGEFLMNEFLDRFAPRLAQLHTLLQVLSHLGGSNATQAGEA